MCNLGTVWPTQSELSRMEAIADRQDAEDRAQGRRLFPTATVEHPNRFDVRYRLTPTVYATVRRGRVRFFETRADGYDYPTTDPR